MPKLKTRKAAAKRFRVTGTGKVMRMYGRRNNHRMKKRNEVLSKLGRTVPVRGEFAATAERLLKGN
jgi:large subunit ribosomal protein L35